MFLSSSNAPHALNDQGVNAGQMRLSWLWQSRHPPVWSNAIPAGPAADFSPYRYLQFRVFVDHQDPFNFADQDLSVELVDGAGLRASVRVADHSRALFLPPALDALNVIPRAIFNSVRVPLGAFNPLFLIDIREVRLVFDQRPEGAINVADLMLADEAANLTPTVQCSVGDDTLQPNGMLVDVALSLAVFDADSAGPPAADLDVFSDQADTDPLATPDAVFEAGDVLSLRGERDPQIGGRVYLLAARASDDQGALGTGCCAVTVPGGDATTAERAADALAQCTRFSATAEGLLPVPEGYHHILQ